MLRQSRAVRPTMWALCASLVFIAAACGGDDTVTVVPGVIDRETFITTYVDVRAETLDRSDLTLPNEARDSILARHGVDAESLLAFVDAYGRELDFMNGVWAEIEARLEALPATPTAGRDPR